LKLDAGNWMQDAGSGMQDAGCRMQDAGYRRLESRETPTMYYNPAP
jgi:hypothetical protein